MALSEAQIGALLRRCERWRALLVGVGWFERWTRLYAVGLVAGLALLACGRALAWPLSWLMPCLVAWTALSAAWSLRRLRAHAIPHWQLPAYVDRMSGARGALMLRQAGHAALVPSAAEQVRFRLPWPRKVLGGAVLFALAYALCWWLPLPAATPPPAAGDAPLAIQRASRIVQQLQAHDAQTRTFKTAAQQTLRALAAQQNGLSRADFDTLARIEAHGKSLLSRAAAAPSDAREALAAADALLSAYAASAGGAREAESLRAGLEGMRDALQNAGLDAGALQAMAEQARQQGSQSKGDPKAKADQQAQPGGPGAFDSKSVEALRQQIGQLQQMAAQQGEGKPGGGPGRDGPLITTTPLELNHHTQERADARFESNTFSTRPGGDTVLLSSGASKRTETAPRAPARNVSSQQFEAGSDTTYWHERRSPQLRGVLERYFEGGAPP